MQTKLKNLKIFRAVQERIKRTMTSSDAFTALDSAKLGFLNLRDFQIGLTTHFGISLRTDEVVGLFNELDKDQGGTIQFQEWDMFIRMNFDEKV